ncbi:MAG: DUF1080 domain-containing protein [Pirellulales bacterium]|nr:DUF1080 domain-containing protein [Pirellulales bacterium]
MSTRVSSLHAPCIFAAILLAGGCGSEKTRPETVVNSHSPFELSLTAEEIAAGWISLFDGESLFGWTATSNANWTVVDGAITVSQGDAGFLRSNSQFADFELSVEFKSALGTNSGIFLHAPEEPNDPLADCYELNIADVGVSPFPTGSFVGRLGASGNEAERRARDKHEWQSFYIRALNGVFTVELDGERVLEYTDPQPLGRGHIILQMNSGAVAFRNIKLRPLRLRDMMTESTYANAWTGTKGRSATFEFANGELSVQGGPGQLESRERFSDFIAQTEIKVNGEGLNSGIFFRNIPGEFQQGYESQIHNGFADNDRSKPVDFGTGAIFRRQAARRIVANDHAWFTKTLICTENHMAVWVNGYPVTEWTDERPEHENPRQGLRLTAGTFTLQAHDPTTDLSFRKFRVTEMPKRRD